MVDIALSATRLFVALVLVALNGLFVASETDETLSEREIRRVLTRSGEAGQVEPEEVEMIEGVFRETYQS